MQLKLWIDDVRPAPDNETYFSVVSVDQAKMIIQQYLLIKQK